MNTLVEKGININKWNKTVSQKNKRSQLVISGMQG